MSGSAPRTVVACASRPPARSRRSSATSNGSRDIEHAHVGREVRIVRRRRESTISASSLLDESRPSRPGWSAARPGARSAPGSSSTPARPRSATRARCRFRHTRCVGLAAQPARRAPRSRRGRGPSLRSRRSRVGAANRARHDRCVSTSRWTKPRCATASCISVGSVTIAASAARSRGDRLGADARELLVGDGGQDHVAAQPAPLRLRCGEHARGEAPLHVVRATPVQPPALEPRRRTDRPSPRPRPCPCARSASATAAAEPASDGDHVRAARSRLLEASSRDPRARTTRRRTARRHLARAAGDDVGVDRLDLDEPRGQLGDRRSRARRRRTRRRSRAPRRGSRAPSSASSRVIVSGGTTMITFQWVIR